MNFVPSGKPEGFFFVNIPALFGLSFLVVISMLRRIYCFINTMVRYYLDFHISRASAALSYFLMLTIFPLLICLYGMLGSLFPAPAEIREILDLFLPDSAVETIMEFVRYISSNVSYRMVSIAIVAMATSSAAGFRIIDKLTYELRGIKRSRRALAFIFSFAFSLVFLAALYLAALLIVSGGRFMAYADRYISFMNVSDNWGWFRFALLFLLLFVMIVGVYRVTAPQKDGVLLVPGAVAASLAMLGVSMVFSWFIGMSARYPIVYGSLASVMIMLLWLYVCGNVLFLGNILNIVLENNNGASK